MAVSQHELGVHVNIESFRQDRSSGKHSRLYKQLITAHIYIYR